MSGEKSNRIKNIEWIKRSQYFFVVSKRKRPILWAKCKFASGTPLVLQSPISVSQLALRGVTHWPRVSSPEIGLQVVNLKTGLYE
jgi:hypothetical protein